MRDDVWSGEAPEAPRHIKIDEPGKLDKEHTARAPEPASAPNGAAHGEMPSFELTLLEKTGGIVSKVISLGSDGKPVSDGSSCWISYGQMRRARLNSLDDLARIIDTRASNQALALGAMNANLPDAAPFCAKVNLASAPLDYVARTGDYIKYREGEPACMLLDNDPKSAPPEVLARVEELGGFLAAVAHLCPEFEKAGYVLRNSTSSGIYNAETGEQHKGSGGQHAYVIAEDGSDVRRFLYVLQDRAWLAGLGYYETGKAGQLLERSIIDWSVGTGERIVFEGAPFVMPPLKQEPRTSAVHGGGKLNTRALLDLTFAEQAELKRIRDEAAAALCKRCKAAREKFIKEKVAEIRAKDPSVTPERARRTVERWIEGVLLPSAVLSFDDEALGIKTVAEVLADPDRYSGETLADPVEGVEYGRNKAIVLRNSSGTVWIYSFAHGPSSMTPLQSQQRSTPARRPQRASFYAGSSSLQNSFLRNGSSSAILPERERAPAKEPSRPRLKRHWAARRRRRRMTGASARGQQARKYFYQRR